MKILFLKWDSFAGEYVEDALNRAGHTLIYYDFPRKTEDTRYSSDLAENIAKAILAEKVSGVFSLNYYPVAAIAAAACKVKYISWTYDSPYIQLYSKTIDYKTNYAFVFDKGEYQNLLNKGIDRVFYLPLAAPVDIYDSVSLSDSEHKHYDSDVSMIGSMYSEHKHDLFRHMKGLDEYTQGYIEGVMTAQSKVYGAYLIDKCLYKDIVQNIRKVCPVTSLGDGYEDVEWTIANYFLARYLTRTERQKFIKGLSEFCNVALYTPEPTPQLKADNRGEIDYYREFPKACKCSKINLNITLRSITTGIPLRAMDILGCGGFLLSNYQEELEEYFVSGRDYVFFESEKDLYDKVKYYLAHDDERRTIADNGHKLMREYHTYDIRIKQMFSTIEADEA